MNSEPIATTKPSAIRRDGQALTELAIVLPLLIILVLGAVDFGRLFYAFQSVESAAAAGAQFGCLNAANAGNAAMIRSNALAQASDITNLFPTVTSTVNGSNISVTVSATFTTLITWPGMPHTVPLQRTVNMRILQ
jgi:Flp pilus assembly protein TadG